MEGQRFGWVLMAIHEHPRMYDAPTLAGYAGLTLEEFSDAYYELVSSGHLAKGGPIHGLIKKKRSKNVRPTQTPLFEMDTRPRDATPKLQKARPDMSWMAPEKKS